MDGSNVVAGLQEVGRERMAKGVTGDVFRHAGGAGGVADRALKDGLVQVVTPTAPCFLVKVSARRGENPLPQPLPGRGAN